MRKAFMLFSAFLLCGVLVFAQQRTVTGQVTDEKGDPVPFASVKVKGSSTGLSADISGNFSINVQGTDAVLIVSSTGYAAQEISVGNSSVVNFILKSQGQLQEVVVTALGISREKKALGYATQGVKGEALVQAGNTGIAGALQGKVSGVEITPSSGMPGASSLITIRGARSFTGDNSPLYVIDGMPISSEPDLSTGGSVTGTDYANRAIDLDPNDIANIEILKGQAASALYGIRASNGVVVITTKSGKGAPKGRPQITFNSTVSLDELSRYPDLTNENGLYAGISVRPVQYIRVDAYADFYKFPWLKYLVDAPSSGKDFFLQFTYTPNKRVEVYTRFRNESKQMNEGGNTTVTNQVVFIPKKDWRTQISVQVNKDILLRNRVELLWYNRYAQTKENGFLSFLDFVYSPPLKRYSGSVRVQYFETGGYNSRLYAYENDLLYSYSIPVFFDKGFRYYLNLNYDVNKRLSCWLKWSQSIFPGKKSIGSGLDEIRGNTKNEAKFQIVIYL